MAEPPCSVNVSGESILRVQAQGMDKRAEGYADSGDFGNANLKGWAVQKYALTDAKRSEKNAGKSILLTQRARQETKKRTNAERSERGWP